MTAYYNENDPDAVHVLRCLIAEGLIAPGIVDDRSITEVEASDLEGFTQIHFFAGAGIWSVAARLAGWPDERPLWSASCPCQPFSAAGKRAGTDDPRHLWPHLYRLIRAARRAGYGPSVLVGEQVAGKAGYDWFDGVRSDLAREEIPARTVDFPALAVNAPHERNRQFWVALALANRWRKARRSICGPAQGNSAHGKWSHDQSGRSDCGAGNLADCYGGGEHRLFGEERGPAETRQREMERQDGQRLRVFGGGADRRDAPAVTLGDGFGAGLEGYSRHGDGSGHSIEARPVAPSNGYRPNRTFWDEYEWVICHDGKARRAKPGIRFLVDGMAGRVPAWRLAGNSLVAEAAAEVIGAVKDVLDAQEAA